jgi:hypothetical protein
VNTVLNQVLEIISIDLLALEHETYGTRVAPIPTASDAVKMNRVLLLNGTLFTIAIPATATDANKNVVIPPRTEAGIETRAAENFAKTPIIIKNMLVSRLVTAKHTFE